jgi:hypothetical protein
MEQTNKDIHSDTAAPGSCVTSMGKEIFHCLV